MILENSRPSSQLRSATICHGCLRAIRLQSRASGRFRITQRINLQASPTLFSPSPFSTQTQKKQQQYYTEKPNNYRHPLALFSGIQPTGVPHIGNYLGALRPWIELQHHFPPSGNIFYSVVDLHSLTAPISPEARRRHRDETVAALLATGVDPKRAVVFRQSAVSAHSELMWILSCHASVGMLSRMTQWKTKANLGADTNILDIQSNSQLRLGLFSYPVLQAADILLHRATHVPVGQDQLQHLEFARECARTFNARYEQISASDENMTETDSRADSGNGMANRTIMDSDSQNDAERQDKADGEDANATNFNFGNEFNDDIEQSSRSGSDDHNTNTFQLETKQPPSPISFNLPILISPKTILSPAKSIKSLRYPDHKMSKTPVSNRPFYPRSSIILLTDTLSDIITKISAATTDSIPGISYDSVARPGISNMLDILFHTLKAEEFDRMKSRDKSKALNLDQYSTLPNTVEELADEYKANSKVAFKTHVADALDRQIGPIRERMAELLGTEPGRKRMEDVLESGAEKARENAEVTMKRVREVVGID